MTTLDLCGPFSLQHATPSTAWMPLDGIIEQWADFGMEATSAPAFQATSAVFAALARETEALEHHLAAWRTPHTADATDLQHAIDQLSQARQHWIEAILSLELIVQETYGPQAAQDAIRHRVREAMEQRVRLSLLIHEVEREHLLASQGLFAAAHREEARR